MTTKRFLALSFVALFLFAAFTAGGCGGSSNLASISDTETPSDPSTPSTPDNPSTPDTAEAQMPSMLEALSSPEFETARQQLLDELAVSGRSAAALTQQIHYVAVTNDEICIWEDAAKTPSGALQSLQESALTESQISELSAKIKQFYDSGDVIAVFSPSPAVLNGIYEALGEPPLYSNLEEVLNNASEDLSPELYALAKRYNDDDMQYSFSYIIPSNPSNLLEDIAEESVSEDVSAAAYLEDYINASAAEDETEENNNSGLRDNYAFQASRLVSFQSWAYDIDEKMDEQQAHTASSEFPLRSAGFSNESGSGELFNYGAQMITLDTSYKDSRYSYCHFSGGAHYTVYSFYNFSDKNEYYYVQANLFVKPEAYKKYTTSAGTKMTSGSMCHYTAASSIIGASHNLFSHAPHNVNRSRTVSDGTSYSTTRTTGYKIGSEVGAEISNEGAKVSAKVTSEYSSSTSKNTGYSHSATWTANDWEIIDRSDSDNALWKVDFYDPTINQANGSAAGYGPHDDGSIVEASTRRNDLDAEWLWQVTSPSKSISIQETLWATMRQTARYSSSRQYWYYTAKKVAKAPLAKPPHIIVKQKNYIFRKDVTDPLLCKVICGGSWTAASDSDWCYVSPKSGEGTNGDERDIFIYADPFDKEGALDTRIAHICIKDTETGQIQTLTITQANK